MDKNQIVDFFRILILVSLGIWIGYEGLIKGEIKVRWNEVYITGPWARLTALISLNFLFSIYLWIFSKSRYDNKPPTAYKLLILTGILLFAGNTLAIIYKTWQITFS